jgi:hypothetical protein
MPQWFRAEVLRALGPPTAGAFVMKSVQGAYGDDANSKGKRGSGFESANGACFSHTARVVKQTSAIDDTMERGESLELRT